MMISYSKHTFDIEFEDSTIISGVIFDNLNPPPQSVSTIGKVGQTVSYGLKTLSTADSRLEGIPNQNVTLINSAGNRFTYALEFFDGTGTYMFSLL